MRRYWREPQPKSMFRGAELARLMTGLLMLLVLYMLIVRARDANTWRWLVSSRGGMAANSSEQPEKPGPAPAKPSDKPQPPAADEPTGPTDEDPDQIATAKEEFQALTDGTLTLGPEEMEAYDRLVEWTKNQSFAQLRKRAKKDLWYTDLHDFPQKHRGEPVAFDLDIRRARDVGKNRYGVDLHEIWGVTAESRSRWYVAIVLDYPPGMPTGWDIRAQAKFAGYFLKLQGYESAEAKPGRPPDRAPLLIGRIEWVPSVTAPKVDGSQEWFWGGIALGVIVLILGGRFLLARLSGKKTSRRENSRILPSSTGEVVPIDVWLDESITPEGEEGNNLDGETEYH